CSYKFVMYSMLTMRKQFKRSTKQDVKWRRASMSVGILLCVVLLRGQSSHKSMKATSHEVCLHNVSLSGRQHSSDAQHMVFVFGNAPLKLWTSVLNGLQNTNTNVPILLNFIGQIHEENIRNFSETYTKLINREILILNSHWERGQLTKEISLMNYVEGQTVHIHLIHANRGITDPVGFVKSDIESHINVLELVKIVHVKSLNLYVHVPPPMNDIRNLLQFDLRFWKKVQGKNKCKTWLDMNDLSSVFLKSIVMYTKTYGSLYNLPVSIQFTK
ncbi:unnamed protein product, partial [Owenia fusiformis]